jgi:hypothetical protein
MQINRFWPEPGTAAALAYFNNKRDNEKQCKNPFLLLISQ